MSIQSCKTHLKSRLCFMAAFLLVSGLSACDSGDKALSPKDLEKAQATAKSAAPLSAEALRASTEQFLEKIRKRDGVEETASGLKYEVITEGTGEMPTADSEVVVHYTGTLTDGTKFDSSRDRGQPAQFPLGGVIPGWTEGLQLMKEGGQTKFYIPSKLGYGERGSPGAIPPNADLIFDVELIKIVGQPEPHPQITAFLERPLPKADCGDMPTPTGSESDSDLADLQAKGNAWQDCMAAFIKEETTGIQTDLNKLNSIEASQVPSEQRMEVNMYLQKFSQALNDIQVELNAYKGISKS